MSYAIVPYPYKSSSLLIKKTEQILSTDIAIINVSLFTNFLLNEVEI